MPVLDLEASVWPEDLFSTEQCIEDSKLRWWVLHTRPRSEKSLARRLVAHKVSFYLPLYQRRQRYQRRLVASYLPLFTSYLFLWGDEQSLIKAFDTKLVVGSIDVMHPAFAVVQLLHILRRHKLLHIRANRQLYGFAKCHVNSPLAIAVYKWSCGSDFSVFQLG